jgi:hypothetical protein
MSDRRNLEETLTALTERIDFPTEPDLGTAVRARVERQGVSPRSFESDLRPPWAGPLRRPILRLALVAIVLAVLGTGALVLSPGARHAVAGWLGVPGIRIHMTQRTPSPVPGNSLYLGRRSTLTTADGLLRGRLRLPSLDRLGAPGAIYMDGADSVVWLVYRPSPGLPGIAGHDDVGLLVTELRVRRLDHFFYNKLVAGGAMVRNVVVDGSPGFWIRGQPHIIEYRGPGGVAQEPGRVSGNSLIWSRNGITYRMELQAGLSTAESLAHSMR